MLLSPTLGQHVGEATADTDTDIVGDTTRDGRTVAERSRAAQGVALTRLPDDSQQATVQDDYLFTEHPPDDEQRFN
jgi:hypothetical protein